MKAAQIVEYGGRDVLQIREIDKPTPGEGEVLIQVCAASVNPFDYKVRSGEAQSFAPLDLPATLGGDFAGVVAELGPGVTGIEVGEAVYGQANAAGGRGSWAEYTPVKIGSLSQKPKTLEFTHAAAVPLTAVSAYQALVETVGLKSGQKILIHGGAGGIGTMAIQLAKHIGTEVATTVSEADKTYVQELGADHVIDYKNEDFTQIVKSYDAVFDTVGGETNTRSYQVLKPGGTLVSMASQPDEALMNQYSVNAFSQFTRTTPERLAAVAELIDNGSLTVHIDKVFSLDHAADALEYLHAGHPKGKVVIEVKAS